MSTEAESTDVQYGAEGPLQMIRGLPMNLKFKKDIVEGVFDNMPLDGDVIIATYPKTGTTWMQYIVIQILTKGESFPTFEDMLYKVIPFLEKSGISALDLITTKPRVYKHHFPYNFVKQNKNSKIIYVYRKPEDTFVSYFHFQKAMKDSIMFDPFFESFMNGTISYGQYFDHILSYVNHKDDGNILFVSYEKLTLHRKEEILRVAKFLGEEYFNSLVNNESLFEKIIQNTSFENMKENLTLLTPKEENENHSNGEDAPRKEINFFRKGVIGDGKKSLTSEQLHCLKTLAEVKMKETDILEEWFSESSI